MDKTQIKQYAMLSALLITFGSRINDDMLSDKDAMELIVRKVNTFHQLDPVDVVEAVAEMVNDLISNIAAMERDEDGTENTDG